MPEQEAVLLTFQDIDTATSGPKAQTLVNRFQVKQQKLMERIHLDNLARCLPELQRNITTANAITPPISRYTIYICGHGFAGWNYIQNNRGDKRITIEQLATLLFNAGLRSRADNHNNFLQTRINMIACLFGRAVNNSYRNSPAAQLHSLLIGKGLYVELVARTEILQTTPTGRQTMPTESYTHRGSERVDSRSKRNYTKIRCGFDGTGAQKIELITDYALKTYVGVDDLPARQEIWAEHAINVLINHVYTKAHGTQYKDERSSVLWDLVWRYEIRQFVDNSTGRLQVVNATPQLLRDRLAALVDPLNPSTDTRVNFLIHRDRFFGHGTPERARLIQRLVDEFPTR